MESFMVYLSQDIEIKQGGIIHFDQIITNTYGAYNMSKGYYECRTGGIYMLTFATEESEHNNTVLTELFVNNRNVAEMATELYDINRKCCTAILYLVTGDKVYVRVTRPGYPKEQNGLKFARFSGTFLYSSSVDDH